MNTCKKLNYQEHYALSLELGGIGKIVVNAGQSPIEGEHSLVFLILYTSRMNVCF